MPSASEVATLINLILILFDKQINTLVLLLLLKENEMITQIDVSCNEISDVGGVALAEALGMI